MTIFYIAYFSRIYKVTSYLYNNELAHNVFFTRGQRLSEEINSDTKDVLRIFIWARKPSTGKIAIRLRMNVYAQVFSLSSIKYLDYELQFLSLWRQLTYKTHAF